jgi:hypothetical protein
MSQNTMRTRTSFNRARGQALLKGGGNVTGMLPGSHDYGSSRASRTTRKGNSLKLSLYQIRSYNLDPVAVSTSLLFSSLALDLQ